MTPQVKIPDVCIIGAGLVGSLMAYELARLGFRVVLLEAGPKFDLGQRPAAMLRRLDDGEYDPWASGTPERDAYTTSGEFSYPLNKMRVKGVGGSTLHWGANALRLVDDDFKLRSMYGIANDGPITYRELEPYYGKAEHALGIVGIADNPFASFRSTEFRKPGFPFSYADQVFERGCSARGIKLHHVPYARNISPYQDRPACHAFGTCETKKICPIGAQYSSERHAEMAIATGRVELITEASVVHINTNVAGRVESVTYVTADGAQREQSAHVFVLAAHTVETARLLLMSTAGKFPHGVANTSGVVGRNFMEHPGIFVTGKIKEPTYPFRIGFHTAETHQFINPANRGEISGLKLDFTNLAVGIPADVAGERLLWGDELAAHVRENFGRMVGIYMQTEQLANDFCHVSLDSSVKDSFGNPVPHLAYSLTDYEHNSLRQHAANIVEPILDAMGATDVTKTDIVFPAHHMGTCRMGSDPARSVVNAQCRAHDVENLFVVGGSVFVTAAVLQPSLTMAALAIRAAEFIGREYSPA